MKLRSIASFFLTCQFALGQIVLVAPPTGVAVTDTVNIQAALNLVQSGGTLQFQAPATAGLAYVVDPIHNNHSQLSYNSQWSAIQPPPTPLLRRSNIRIAGAAPLTTGGNTTVLRFTGFNPNIHTDSIGQPPFPEIWACGLHVAFVDGLVIENIDIEVASPLATEGILTAATINAGVVTFRLDVTDPTMRGRMPTSAPALLSPPATPTPGPSTPGWRCSVLFPVFGASSPYARQAFKDAIVYGPSVNAIRMTAVGATSKTIEVDVSTGGPSGLSTMWSQFFLRNAISSGVPIVMCLGHQYNNVWRSQGLKIQECTDVRISGCSIKSVGWGVSIESCKNVVCENVSMGPTNPSWMIGEIRGAFGGIYGTRGRMHFRNCNMVGGFDDYIELTGSQWSKLDATPSPAVMQISSTIGNMPDNGIEPGSWGAGSLLFSSEAEFFATDLSSSLGRRTIRLAGPNPPYGLLTPTSWDLTANSAPWRIALDRSPPTSAAGTPVLLRGNIFESALVEGCRFEGGKGSGVMVAGSNVTIRGCEFVNLDSPAIRAHCIFDAFQPTGGLNVVGPPAENLLIDGNVILRCNRWTQTRPWPWPSWAHWGHAIGAIDISTNYVVGLSTPSGTEVRRSPGNLARGIFIRKNTIRDTGRAGINVASASMVTIVDNQILDTGMDWRGGISPVPAVPGAAVPHTEISGGRCALVRLEYCDVVAVHGNRGGNQPPFSAALHQATGVNGLWASNNNW